MYRRLVVVLAVLSASIAATSAPVRAGAVACAPISAEPPPVGDPSTLARELASATRQLANQSPGEPKRAELLEGRRAAFASLMVSDPARAAEVLAAAPLAPEDAASPGCTEQPATVSGTVERHMVDLADGGHREVRYVAGEMGRVRVHTSEDLASESVVEVRGMRLGDDLLVTEPSRLQPPAGGEFLTGPPAVVADAAGPQPTAVIMVDFTDTPRPDLTKAKVDDVVFREVGSYFSEASYGRASFSGRSFGWYDLPIARTCDVGRIQAEAIRAADAEASFPSYSRLLIIGAFRCDWRGYGTYGKVNITSADGSSRASVAFVDPTTGGSFDAFVAAHELGHGLALGHSGSLRCADGGVRDGCPVLIYGDPFSVMGGSGAAGHLPAPMKDHLGWFGPGNLREVTASGRYVIEPFETATGGIKALRLQRKTTDQLFVEYRRPIGWDAKLSVWPGTDVFEGATLHFLPPTAPYPTGNLSSDSLLIDPTPPTNPTTSALKVGESFTDPASGARVSVVSRTDAALTVDVTMGKTDFTAPTVSLTSPVSLERVSGTVTATAEASAPSGIQKVVFSHRRPGQPSVDFATDTTAPYSAQLDTTALAEGDTFIVATAFDRSGEAYGAAANTKETSNLVYITRSGPSSTTTTTRPPSAYMCTGATDITASSATLTASTTDTSVTSASFTLTTNGGVTQVGGIQTVAGPPFRAPVTYLEPGRGYSYKVVFNPGNRAQDGAPCTFFTLDPPATTTTSSTVPPTTTTTSATTTTVAPTTTTRAPTTTVAPATTTTVAPGFSYACTAATSLTATSARLGASTTDPAVTSATFLLRRAGVLVGPSRTVAGPPFATTVSGLAPATAYTYTVVFSPGGRTQANPPCGFTTAGASTTTTVAPATTTTVAPGFSYACSAATSLTATSARLGASTNDPAVRYATFVVRLNGTPVGSSRTVAGPPFGTTVSGLRPNTSYTYTVTFTPGGRATAACAFRTTG